MPSTSPSNEFVDPIKIDPPSDVVMIFCACSYAAPPKFFDQLNGAGCAIIFELNRIKMMMICRMFFN